MDDVSKYREYAQECRRMAARAPEKDKAVLLEIAEAWTHHAEQIELTQKKGLDGTGGSDDMRDDPPPQSR